MTDSGLLIAIVSAAAAFAAALISGWYTYRATKRTTEATREVERDKLASASWEAQVLAWREDVVTLRRQRAEDKAEADAEAERAAKKITSCHERIDHLVQVVDAMERRERALTRWAREVVEMLRLAEVAYPPPPHGVIQTNPRGWPPATPTRGEETPGAAE